MNVEPVSSARVFIEIIPANIPVADVETNADGEFHFSVPTWVKIRENDDFKITFFVPIKLLLPKKEKILGVESHTIIIPIDDYHRRDFVYRLIYIPENDLVRAENKGAFAVSGKNSTIT